jgi:hypothetical protein
MAQITIEDLPQSDALDREAMRSIVGGSATGARPLPVGQIEAGSGRVVDYPPGFGHHQGPVTVKSRQPSR